MSFEIPLFELNYGPEETAAALAVLQSGWLSMGPRVQQFEEEFGRLLNVQHVLGVTNCTAALHLALQVLDIGPGDEVIVPSLTFVATVNAVRYVGADPVFADIVGPSDLSLDPQDVEEKITPRTRAILVMHYGGFAVEMGRISDLAAARGLAVIEDAAHAPLARWRDRCLGTIGTVGCFSFFSNKNITCAEGGAIVTGRSDLADRLRLLRAHGMTTLSFERAKGHATSYDVLELGYNYRLDDLRASLLVAQLQKLETDLTRRAEVRDRYLAELAGCEQIVVPYRDFTHVSSNYIMPVLLREGGAARRERLREKLAEAGIQTSVHYPAVHRFSIYEPYRASLPRTDHATDNELTLPMYPSLTGQQVAKVCRVLKENL